MKKLLIQITFLTILCLIFSSKAYAQNQGSGVFVLPSGNCSAIQNPVANATWCLLPGPPPTVSLWNGSSYVSSASSSFPLTSNVSAAGFKIQSLGTNTTTGDALSQGQSHLNDLAAATGSYNMNGNTLIALPAAASPGNPLSYLQTGAILDGLGLDGAALTNMAAGTASGQGLAWGQNGAVLEGLQASVNGGINPRDPRFGALGNGSNDDTVALQSAYDNAATNKLFLKLPPGDYKTTYPIMVHGDNQETPANIVGDSLPEAFYPVANINASGRFPVIAIFPHDSANAGVDYTAALGTLTGPSLSGPNPSLEFNSGHPWMLDLKDDMTGTWSPPGTVTWAATTTYPLGTVTLGNLGGKYMFVVTTAGTSGASQPNWSSCSGNGLVGDIGCKITDGTVTWTNEAALGPDEPLGGLGAFTVEGYFETTDSNGATDGLLGAMDSLVPQDTGLPSNYGDVTHGSQLKVDCVVGSDFQVVTTIGATTFGLKSTACAANTIYEWALVYNGSTLSLYFGTPGATGQAPVATTSASGVLAAYPSQTLILGGDSTTFPHYTPSDQFVGYQSEIRISNTARYSGTITLPSGALTGDSNTLLLIHPTVGNVAPAKNETWSTPFVKDDYDNVGGASPNDWMFIWNPLYGGNGESPEIRNVSVQGGSYGIIAAQSPGTVLEKDNAGAQSQNGIELFNNTYQSWIRDTTVVENSGPACFAFDWGDNVVYNTDAVQTYCSYDYASGAQGWGTYAQTKAAGDGATFANYYLSNATSGDYGYSTLSSVGVDNENGGSFPAVEVTNSNQPIYSYNSSYIGMNGVAIQFDEGFEPDEQFNSLGDFYIGSINFASSLLGTFFQGTYGPYVHVTDPNNWGGTNAPQLVDLQSRNQIVLHSPVLEDSIASGAVHVLNCPTNVSSGASGSITLNTPSCAPPGTVEIALMNFQGNPTLTAPVGWTSVGTYIAADNNLEYAVYRHVSSTSDPASWSWTYTGAYWDVGTLYPVVGVDRTNPIDQVSENSANSTPVTVAGLTGSYANDPVLATAGTLATAVFSSVSGLPTGAQKVGNVIAPNGNPQNSYLWGQATTAIPAITWNTSVANDIIGVTIAFRPEANTSPASVMLNGQTDASLGALTLNSGLISNGGVNSTGSIVITKSGPDVGFFFATNSASGGATWDLSSGATGSFAPWGAGGMGFSNGFINPFGINSAGQLIAGTFPITITNAVGTLKASSLDNSPWAVPGAIGGTTPNSGSFSSVTLPSLAAGCLEIATTGSPVTSTGAGCGGGSATPPGGTTGQFQYNNSGVFGGFTLSGDCTAVASTGVITCTKSNGTAFGTAAFDNTGTSGATLGLLNGNLTFGGTDTFSIAPTMSGANITSATIPDAALVTAPVTDVTGTSPIVSSGGATPAISIGNIPVANLNSGTGASSSTFWRGDGTWATPSGGGTVTSVGQTVPSWLTVAGSPITGSGTLAITGTSETANQVLASPNGISGAMAPRALVGADLPNPSASTLGGIESAAAVAHEWIDAISTAGVPALTQPACGDLSNSGAGCTAATMTATVGGLVPTPPNNTTTFLRGDGTFATPAGGGGGVAIGGKVVTTSTTSVAVTTNTLTSIFSTAALTVPTGTYRPFVTWGVYGDPTSSGTTNKCEGYVSDGTNTFGYGALAGYSLDITTVGANLLDGADYDTADFSSGTVTFTVYVECTVASAWGVASATLSKPSWIDVTWVSD